MIAGIVMLLIAIWTMAGFISLFFYQNPVILAAGVFLYLLCAIIFIGFCGIKKIIEEIQCQLYWHSRNKHDKEYAKYKEEVLDSKYCYTTFDEWKRKQEIKR